MTRINYDVFSTSKIHDEVKKHYHRYQDNRYKYTELYNMYLKKNKRACSSDQTFAHARMFIFPGPQRLFHFPKRSCSSKD